MFINDFSKPGHFIKFDVSDIFTSWNWQLNVEIWKIPQPQVLNILRDFTQIQNIR
jgi:hypothetical protein